MAETTDDRQSIVARGQDGLGNPQLLDVSRPEPGSKSEQIRHEIDATRAALDHKLDALQDKVRNVQTKAKETLSLTHQIQEHPWAMFGSSVGAGFLLGLVLGPQHEQHVYEVRGGHSMMEPMHYPVQAVAATREKSHSTDLFETLKLAAGAALTDLLRTTIKQYSPALGQQLDKIWQERGMTATSVASSFLNRPKREPKPTPASVSPGSTSYGSEGLNYSGSDLGANMAEDFDAEMEPTHEANVRGEVTSRA